MKNADDKAMQCYKQILEYDSLHTPTLNRIGTLLCSQGHFDQAIAFHKRALSIRPNDAAAYKYIGKAYIDWGQYDKAIQSFIRSTNICTTDPETYMYLAELYGKQRKHIVIKSETENNLFTSLAMREVLFRHVLKP